MRVLAATCTCRARAEGEKMSTDSRTERLKNLLGQAVQCLSSPVNTSSSLPVEAGPSTPADQRGARPFQP